MTTARSRISKGRNFQKKIKELIQECFDLNEDDIRTAIGAENGPDVILINKESRDKVGLAIECKNSQSLSIWKALDQAKAHAKNTNLEPTLIFHRSVQGNSDVWLTCPFEHYLNLRKELLELKNIDIRNNKIDDCGE